MVFTEAVKYITHAGNGWVDGIIIIAGLGFIVLLVITVLYPLISRYRQTASVRIHPSQMVSLGAMEKPQYYRIAVALDFSKQDEKVITNAVANGNEHTEYILIHVVESASAKYFGTLSDDFETRKDQEQLDGYLALLHARNLRAKGVLGYRHPAKEIVRIVKAEKADFIVMGSHGHRGIKDWIYGETAHQVRHHVKIPVLLVQ
jgi:manganese transport protein